MKIPTTFFLWLSFAFANPLTVNAQQSCESSGHHQFDFWIGEWQVYDTLQQLIGTNRIEADYKHCLLREEWESARGSKGTSYNYYQTSDSTWHQLWIDDSGTQLALDGQWDGTAMRLSSKPFVSQQQMRKHRISWIPDSDGPVWQIWEVLDEDDQRLNLLFKGQYKKKKEG